MSGASVTHYSLVLFRIMRIGGWRFGNKCQNKTLRYAILTVLIHAVHLQSRPRLHLPVHLDNVRNNGLVVDSDHK